jgi:hypothetical protein
MNQATKAFLTEFRDLCRRHNVEFHTRGPLDGKGMSFLSVGWAAPWVNADVESLEDMENQLAADSHLPDLDP